MAPFVPASESAGKPTTSKLVSLTLQVRADQQTYDGIDSLYLEALRDALVVCKSRRCAVEHGEGRSRSARSEYGTIILHEFTYFRVVVSLSEACWRRFLFVQLSICAICYRSQLYARLEWIPSLCDLMLLM